MQQRTSTLTQVRPVRGAIARQTYFETTFGAALKGGKILSTSKNPCNYESVYNCEMQSCEGINSTFIEAGGAVYLTGTCEAKKKFAFLLDNDAEFFKEVHLGLGETKTGPVTIALDKIKENAHFVRDFVINPTFRCNSDCKVCYSYFIGSRDLTAGEVRDLLSNFKERVVNLLGGEPTVHSDLPGIIRAIKDTGNHPRLFSNGFLLQNKDYVRTLKEAGLESVYLSFDGVSPEVYSKMKWKESDLGKKLNALKTLKAEGVPVVFAVTIVPGVNDKELPKLISFAARAKAAYSFRIYQGVTNLGRFDVSMKGRIATPSDIIKGLEEQTGGKVGMRDFMATYRLRKAAYFFAMRFFGRTVSERIRPIAAVSAYVRAKPDGTFQAAFPAEDLEKAEKILSNSTKRGNALLALGALPLLLKGPMAKLFLSVAKNSLLLGRHAREEQVLPSGLMDIRVAHFIDKETKPTYMYVPVKGKNAKLFKCSIPG